MDIKEWNGSAFVDTGDRYWYLYSPAGRLLGADFAAVRAGSLWNPQTPGGGAWGAQLDGAVSYVRARYEYDTGGRPTEVRYARWAPMQGGPDWTFLRRYRAAYEAPWGLKSSTAVDVGSGQTWVATDRGQAYTYEPERDFLASASYTKSGWANQAWTYGPTGNREDGTYDQLDRIVTQGSRRFKHDILGNRTETDWQNSALFRATKWDGLGRMRSYQSTEGGSVYR